MELKLDQMWAQNDENGEKCTEKQEKTRLQFSSTPSQQEGKKSYLSVQHKSRWIFEILFVLIKPLSLCV